MHCNLQEEEEEARRVSLRYSQEQVQNLPRAAKGTSSSRGSERHEGIPAKKEARSGEQTQGKAVREGRLLAPVRWGGRGAESGSKRLPRKCCAAI